MLNDEDPRVLFNQRLHERLYKALDYLTLFLYVVVVSVGALVADLLIVQAILKTVLPTVSQYTVVAHAFDWFQIGSAFLSLIGAGIHAVLSTYSQFKFEVDQIEKPKNSTHSYWHLAVGIFLGALFVLICTHIF